MHLHQITLEIGGKINHCQIAQRLKIYHCQIAQRLLLTNLRSIYWNITTNTSFENNASTIWEKKHTLK